MTLSDFVAPYLMGQYQPLAGMSCRRPDHEEILCDCDLVVIQFLSIALFQDCFRIIHHPHQGSLLISKLEFFIKADFRGLGFLSVGPMQFFIQGGFFNWSALKND